MPLGPSSRASDFAHPITPGRIAFERARLSIGSRTVLDVTFTTRPHRALLEVGETQPRQAHDGDEEELRSCLDLLRGELSSLASRRSAGVVDHDVDPAERLHRRADQPLEVAGARNVAYDREPTKPFGLALEEVFPPGEHDDVRTLACK